MMRSVYTGLICFFWGVKMAAAQPALNVSLFGQLNPEPIHYAGCWAYADGSGREYALLGAFHGTSIISIDDSTDIHEISYINGPASNWREMTVLGNTAYVVSEGKDSLRGLQMMDLSLLPDSAVLSGTYTTTFSSAHMVSRDVYSDTAFIYVCGSDSTGGVHILDVSDPLNPVEVGLYAPYYIHDAHVRGNFLFAAAVYNGTLDIVDISDRSKPVLISQLSYPGAFTHSSWTSSDGNHLFVADEKDGLPARIWDITNPSDPRQVARYSGNYQSLVHNPYIRGDFAFISHNTEGLRVVDLFDPSCPAEVGYYDTYPGASGGFRGLWSACPFLPSGKIIGGNREDGLYVWKFNGSRGARIYGLVLDSITGLPVPGATLQLNSLANTALSDLSGRFAIGGTASPPAGYTLTTTAAGYLPHVKGALVVGAGDSIWVEVLLVDSLHSGIPDTEKHAAGYLEVFPQPAGEFLFFKIHPHGRRILRTEIVDMNGRVRTVQVKGLSKGQYALMLPRASKIMPPGSYLLCVYTDTERIRSLFVVGDAR